MTFLDKKTRSAMSALLTKVSQLTWISWADVVNLLAIIAFLAHLLFFLGVRIAAERTIFSLAVSIVICFYLVYTLDKYLIIQGVFKRQSKALRYITVKYNMIPGANQLSTAFDLGSAIILTGIVAIHSFLGHPPILPSPVISTGFDLMWIHLMARFVSYLTGIALIVYVQKLDEFPELVTNISNERKAEDTNNEGANKKE